MTKKVNLLASSTNTRLYARCSYKKRSNFGYSLHYATVSEFSLVRSEFPILARSKVYSYRCRDYHYSANRPLKKPSKDEMVVSDVIDEVEEVEECKISYDPDAIFIKKGNEGVFGFKNYLATVTVLSFHQVELLYNGNTSLFSRVEGTVPFLCMSPIFLLDLLLTYQLRNQTTDH